jgi:hypothetical protein
MRRSIRQRRILCSVIPTYATRWHTATRASSSPAMRCGCSSTAPSATGPARCSSRRCGASRPRRCAAVLRSCAESWRRRYKEAINDTSERGHGAGYRPLTGVTDAVAVKVGIDGRQAAAQEPLDPQKLLVDEDQIKNRTVASSS